jgi:hypothetical protein
LKIAPLIPAPIPDIITIPSIYKQYTLTDYQLEFSIAVTTNPMRPGTAKFAKDPTISAIKPKNKAQQLSKAYENTVFIGDPCFNKTLTNGAFDLSTI